MAGSSTAGAGQSRREARRPSAVLVPALISGCVGLGLATTGFSLVGFGIATSCTDEHESLHGCDAMYHWMHVGRAGQWVLVLPVAALLVLGLAWPASRKVIAVSMWALAAVAFAWFAFYMSSAASTF